MEEVDVDNQPFRFGKHVGRTPGEVVDVDPGYLVWFWLNIQDPQLHMTEAMYKYAKASKNFGDDVNYEDDAEMGDFYGISPWGDN